MNRKRTFTGGILAVLFSIAVLGAVALNPQKEAVAAVEPVNYHQPCAAEAVTNGCQAFVAAEPQPLPATGANRPTSEPRSGPLR